MSKTPFQVNWINEFIIQMMKESFKKRGLVETIPGTVKHYFNEFKDAVLIVSRIQNISFLQDMLIDV
jgi:hypothetical protein